MAIVNDRDAHCQYEEEATKVASLINDYATGDLATLLSAFEKYYQGTGQEEAVAAWKEAQDEAIKMSEAFTSACNVLNTADSEAADFVNTHVRVIFTE
jgi:hypothetical protein